jgi:hypothetical protein
VLALKTMVRFIARATILLLFQITLMFQQKSLSQIR